MNQTTPKKKFDWSKETFEFFDSVVLSAVLVLLVFTLVFRVFIVNGPSMKPTLTHEDRLVVSNLFYTPKNGDIICFYNEFKDEVLIKRVIATEGQTVDIDENYAVYVDGKKLDEPYIFAANTKPQTVSLPLTVKEGCVFVLGDNRVDSMDSRYLEVGQVDTNKILGKLIIRLFPKFGKVG